MNTEKKRKWEERLPSRSVFLLTTIIVALASFIFYSHLEMRYERQLEGLRGQLVRTQQRLKEANDALRELETDQGE